MLLILVPFRLCCSGQPDWIGDDHNSISDGLRVDTSQRGRYPSESIRSLSGVCASGTTSARRPRRGGRARRECTETSITASERAMGTVWSRAILGGSLNLVFWFVLVVPRVAFVAFFCLLSRCLMPTVRDTLPNDTIRILCCCSDRIAAWISGIPDDVHGQVRCGIISARAKTVHSGARPRATPKGRGCGNIYTICKRVGVIQLEHQTHDISEPPSPGMIETIATDPSFAGSLSKDFTYGFASASYQIEVRMSLRARLGCG